MSSTVATVFVTGGAGYVGSHTVLELLEANYRVIVADNFANAVKGSDGITKPESLKRVENITGRELTFYDLDLQDKTSLDRIFKDNSIDCVIHFAALKAVGESVQIPLQYYKNNVGGTITLLEVMKENNVKKIIFSSSATVYGEPQYVPIDEQHPVGTSCTNPYGRTKYFSEEIMKDVYRSEKVKTDFKIAFCHFYWYFTYCPNFFGIEGWSILLLRYFNPVGAHHSGLIGEDPLGIPNNLMPFIAQVAVGRRPELLIFGNDYDTKDGTGVRDYIHVCDLATGHLAALKKMLEEGASLCKAYNLGLGQGFSVLEVVDTFIQASGRNVPYRFVSRRQGDVPAMYADVSLAATELQWKAERSLLTMCEDTWRWQFLNPNGYSSLK